MNREPGGLTQATTMQEVSGELELASLPAMDQQHAPTRGERVLAELAEGRTRPAPPVPTETVRHEPVERAEYNRD